MKISRVLLALMLVLSVTAAVTMLAQAPAQGGGQGGGGAAAGGGGGGRGPAPVAIATPTPEVMNEDPQTETMRNDRMNFPPFKILGNLYYVGTAFCGSYLITTPMGNILINTNYEETVPLMKAGIESLGFKFEDTKILLASHAHADHQTGDAMVKQMVPGLTTEFMAEDVPAIQNIKPAGKEHPIDKVLHDGDVVSLGGMNLTAHLNPGHTLGCTTWTFPVMDAGRRYNVTIICGGLQDNARLVFNAQQPDIGDIWMSTINKWKTYPTDVFLGAHTWFFNLTGKYKAMKANPRVNPWIDPDGYKKYIASVEELRAQLIKDQTAAGPPAPRGGGRGGAGGGAGGAGGGAGGAGAGRGPGN